MESAIPAVAVTPAIPLEGCGSAAKTTGVLVGTPTTPFVVGGGTVVVFVRRLRN
jgi:hypothetical protein